MNPCAGRGSGKKRKKKKEKERKERAERKEKRKMKGDGVFHWRALWFAMAGSQ